MKLSSSFIVCFSGLSFLVPVISCNNNTNQPSENVIYYYPEKNIYYDSLQSNYYYSLDGARSWDSMTYKGPGYGAVLGSKIPIKRTGENVWANNEAHRKEYNGVVLNIINHQTILISRNDSINRLIAIARSQARPELTKKEMPPEVKGLKKFFNKLFGKKKKPVEEKTP